MKVDKQKAMTPPEEYEYWQRKLDKACDFLPWDVHPNKINASNIYERKIRKKLKDIVDSPEGREYYYL